MVPGKAYLIYSELYSMYETPSVEQEIIEHKLVEQGRW